MVAELTGIPVATSVPGRSASRPSRFLGCNTGCSTSSSSSTIDDRFEGDPARRSRERKRPRWIRTATREPIYSVLDHREKPELRNRAAASPTRAIGRERTFEYEISAVRNGESSLDHEAPPIYRRCSEEIDSREFREEQEEEEEEEEHALYSVVKKPPKNVARSEVAKLPVLEEEETNDPREEILKKQRELHKWLQSAGGEDRNSGKETEGLGEKKLPISYDKEANDPREEILKKQRELHKWLKSAGGEDRNSGKETEGLGEKKLPISYDKEANDHREETLKKQRELHKWLRSASGREGNSGKETEVIERKKFKMNSEDSLEEKSQRREEMESQKGEDTWSSPGVSIPRGVVGMVGPFCRIYQNPNERREYMLKEEVQERGVDVGDAVQSEKIYHRMDDEYEEGAVDTASESTFVGDSNKIIGGDYEVDEDSLVAEQQQYRRRAKWRIVDEGEGRECVVQNADKEEEDEKKSIKNREWSKDRDDDDGHLGHIGTKENYDLDIPPKYTSRRSVASNEPHDKDSLNETGSTTGGTVEGNHSGNPARGERSGGPSDPVNTSGDRRPISTAAPPRSLVSRILARARSPDDLLDHSEPYSQLWIVLSNVYGELVVVLMMALCLAEVMDTPVPLLSLQSIYLMYLYIGSIAVIISIYLWVLVDSCGSLANGNSEDAELGGASLTRFGSLKRAHISRARTAPTSFYIRVGALLFGLATLVFNGLEMAMHSMMQGAECLSDVVFVHPVLHGLFTFLQMHFLFVNSQVLVERFGLAARFGFTHLAATNIAVWARLVIWDSAQEWTYFVHLAQQDPEKASSPLNLRGFPGSLTRRARDLLGRASSESVVFHPYQPISDEQISQVVTLQECLNTNTLGQLWTSSMPFLYPFIVQFSLIAAAVTYVMGQNVGRNRYCHKQKFHSSKDLTSHMRVGCDGSSKGLFLGILCMTAGIVVILIFLVVREDENFSPATLSWLTCGTLIGILALSGVMTASGLVQVRQMSIVSRAPSALDGILSNVALFGVQLYSVFTAVVCACALATFDAETEDADSQGRHAMLLAASVLQLIQCFAQSTLLAETSKRSCITRFQMMAKPARQVITFLLFSNAVLWAFDTVVTQNWVSQQMQLRFFGVLAWGIVSRICLPLVVFYRFHSCVLLLEAWNKCYRTPRGEHPLN